jgi:hypothetical protein
MRPNTHKVAVALSLLLVTSAAGQPVDSTTRPGAASGDTQSPFPRGLLRNEPLSPGGCARHFAQPTPAGAACTFAGTWNKRCRHQSLRATFVSNGRHVAVVLEEPFAFFVSDIGDGRDGRLRAAGVRPDFSDARRTDGILSISSSGRRLVIAPAPAPFRLGGCDFVQYSGTFVTAPEENDERRAGRARALLGSLRR